MTVPCDDPNFGLAPYVWQITGSNSDARAEATMPGAYFKTIVTGTTTLGLVIDGTANLGNPPSSMPVIEYSFNDGPFAIVPLTKSNALYTLAITNGLAVTSSNTFEVYFRAADLLLYRWILPIAHLRIAGLSMDATGTLAAYPMRPKKAIAYGDSITEGVGVDSLFTSWEILAPNNARGAWVGFVSDALNCEYGQLGSGGQGMVAGPNVPPLPSTWDYYDSTNSRLTDGLLIPEPDYVFCAEGQNDSMDITSAYTNWLSAVRNACPDTHIFCIVPPAGVHLSEITAAVNARNQAGDAKVYLIDIPLMLRIAPNLLKPTQGSYDGGHPTLYGQGVFASCITAAVQQILTQELQPTPPTLSVTLLPGQAALAWPTNAAGFTLQQTASLTPPVVWSFVPNVPVIVGGQYNLTLGAGGATQFFRLAAQ
jgi:lysophospholipase L1-like esterase